jgi:murein DD-endopeptidase MepM/ murein hydrolase activator NlpD
MKHLGKIIIGSIGIGLLGLSTLLIIEYRFFHDQAQKMLELKEEYRTYTLAVKKILNEYNAMKEQAEGSSDADASEQEEEKDSFILVNREPSYLKQSTISHARTENLEFLLKAVDFNEWADYSDQIKRKPTTTGKKRKKRSRAIRTNNVQSFPKFYNDGIITAAKDINFVWPIKRSDFWLSSFFGPRRKPDRSWGFHYGIDMAACKGTPVVSAADGIVIEAHFHSGYGNTILISHSNKYKTRYAHLDKMHVSVGQKVEQGQLIGKVGATGAVRKRKGRDASHLHFEVYAHGKQINPLSYFM